MLHVLVFAVRVSDDHVTLDDSNAQCTREVDPSALVSAPKPGVKLTLIDKGECDMLYEAFVHTIVPRNFANATISGFAIWSGYATYFGAGRLSVCSIGALREL